MRRLWAALRKVRRRWLRLTLMDGVLWALLAFTLVLWGSLVLDRWLDLPRSARIACGILNLIVVGAVLVFRLVLPLARIPRRDALALYVERRRPELRSRLISAVQLARETPDSPDAAEFIRRLVEDADRAASGFDPRELASGRTLSRTACVVLPLLVAAAVVFLAGGATSRILLRRALLEEVPVPRKTRLIEVTGPRTLGRGDDLALFARAEGVIPREGKLLIRHGSGRVQTLALEADARQHGRFERVLANIPASFRYRLRIHDAESEEYAVDVLPRPAVTNLVLTQVLPGYTRLEPRVLAPDALVLLRGSRLRLEGIASQPLSRADVRLEGLDQTVAATLDPANPLAFRAEFEVRDERLQSFTVDLVDQREIASRESAVYAVQVVPDKAPKVRMILPARREELATPRGIVLLSFEANDDFGLANLRLRHQPAGATHESAVELDLAGETNALVRRRFEWKLATIQPLPAEGEFIEFWVEATDANEVDGPGLGSSERYLLRIVSEAEKRADLLTRAGDAIGRLGGVAEGQERLNETLGRIILTKPPTP